MKRGGCDGCHVRTPVSRERSFCKLVWSFHAVSGVLTYLKLYAAEFLLTQSIWRLIGFGCTWTLVVQQHGRYNLPNLIKPTVNRQKSSFLRCTMTVISSLGCCSIRSGATIFSPCYGLHILCLIFLWVRMHRSCRRPGLR